MAELYTLSLLSDGNLQAYYRFESGSRLVDDSGNSRTLTNVGTPTYASGKYGDGLNVQATANYVKYTGDIGVLGNGSMSIPFWIKLNNEITTGDWCFFQHQINTGTTRYLVLYYEYNGGTRRLRLDSSGTSYYYNITMGTADWYHIAVVRTTTTNVKLYIDNVEQISNTPGTGAAGGASLEIGSNTVKHTDAIFDDIGVFDRVLTVGEIDELFSLPLASFMIMM